MFDSVTLERFWSKVDKTGGPDACWPWTGSKTRGYGGFWAEGKMHRATHVAVKADGRNMLDRQVVCHSCDNPPCVNPAHLFVGYQADNVRDMREKNRDVPPPTVRGEAGWQARKTHCKNGHPFEGENLMRDEQGYRQCRICVGERRRAADRRSYWKKKAEAAL